jgi:hypothetical protein
MFFVKTRLVGMPRNDNIDLSGSRIQIQLLEIMQYINVAATGLHQFCRRQFTQRLSSVDVPFDRNNRSERPKAHQYFGISHIASMDNQVRARQALQYLFSEQTMRIGHYSYACLGHSTRLLDIRCRLMKRLYNPALALAAIIAVACFDLQQGRAAHQQASDAANSITRPPIIGIAHIGLFVSDMTAADQFFGHVLGYDHFSLNKQTGGLMLNYYKVNDHQYIEIYPGLTSPTQDRLSHIAFETLMPASCAIILTAKG